MYGIHNYIPARNFRFLEALYVLIYNTYKYTSNPLSPRPRLNPQATGEGSTPPHPSPNNTLGGGDSAGTLQLILCTILSYTIPAVFPCVSICTYVCMLQCIVLYKYVHTNTYIIFNPLLGNCPYDMIKLNNE